MIITQTPLRISFAGGGTDIPNFYREHGGCVLNAAIDKYVYVIVKERFDDLIYVNYSKKEIVETLDDLHHELVREAMRLTGVEKGVEITTLADIPSAGSGLGSSSTVTVGLLNALYAYQGINVSAEQLAREACQIEIQTLKKPIGKQDQYIAAYGHLRRFTFHPDETVEMTPVPLSEQRCRDLQQNLLLFFTGMTRRAESVLTKQIENMPRQDCRNALLAMKDQVDQVWEALQNGSRLDAVGEILHQGWMYKKTLANAISNPHIDELYDRARKAGAIGGKVAGAGGGGFLLLYVPLERQEAVRQALSHLRELPFAFSRDGSKIIFNVRR
jgi:D-glycero-alpha-D-manno-heptose-7-phosphate kinase